MAKTETSTEIDPWDVPATGLAVIEATPEQIRAAYEAISKGTVPPELGDPNITAAAMLLRIQEGSLEESMTPADALPNWGKEYEGVPVVVRGFHLNRSTFQQEENGQPKGPSTYAVVDLQIRETAELVTAQTGSATVQTQLVKALEDKQFPFMAAYVVTPTSTPGRSTHRLVRPEKA